jgi:hypothetical protein
MSHHGIPSYPPRKIFLSILAALPALAVLGTLTMPGTVMAGTPISGVTINTIDADDIDGSDPFSTGNEVIISNLTRDTLGKRMKYPRAAISRTFARAARKFPSRNAIPISSRADGSWNVSTPGPTAFGN